MYVLTCVLCMRVYVCVCVCEYVYVYVLMCVYVCLCVCMGFYGAPGSGKCLHKLLSLSLHVDSYESRENAPRTLHRVLRTLFLVRSSVNTGWYARGWP